VDSPENDAALNARQDDLPRIQRRTVLTLALAQLSSGVGSGVALAVGSLMAVQLSGRQELAGTSTMAISLAGALMALPLASAAAVRGRRFALAAGLLLALVGTGLMVLAPVAGSFPLVLAGSALIGAGTAANLQARFAAADLARPEHRGRDLSFVVWSITIGAVAGPNLIRPGAALGVALGLPEISGPFLISMAGLVIAIVLLVAGLRPDPLLHARRLQGEAAGEGTTLPARRRGSLRAGLAAVRQSPAALVGLVTVAGAHLVMVAVMSMTPVHLQLMDQASGQGHSSADTLAVIGFTISLHIAGMYALSPVFGMLTDRFGRPALIVAGQVLLLAATGLAGLGHAHQGLVAGGLVALGLGWSASTIAGSTLLSESVAEADRVLVQGVSDACMGAAGAAGAALSGVVLATAGFAGLNAAAAVAAAAVLGIALTGRRETAPSRGR
jgi:MFS family permease